MNSNGAAGRRDEVEYDLIRPDIRLFETEIVDTVARSRRAEDVDEGDALDGMRGIALGTAIGCALWVIAMIWLFA